MDETAADLADEVTKRFPEGVLQEVTVLGYGDDPAVEPGATGIRVTINPGQFPPDTDDPLHAFDRAHGKVVKKLHHDLGALPLSPGSWVEFWLPTEDGKRRGRRILLGPRDDRKVKERPGESTMVTARLGAAQLETLDTLITAGIAANRAEAVRWALDRISDRPAFARLRERAREIDELKAQL